MLIEFGGQEFHLHYSGAMYWPARKTLILSDLHIEKGSSFLKRRLFLPPYDTAETLSRVDGVISFFQPDRILLLGDIFHDAKAYGRMSDVDRARFDTLLSHDRVIWVEGNHDKGSNRVFVDEHREDGLVFRHIAAGDDGFEISGHYHPAASIRHKGQKVRTACFVCTEGKLLMPSFGTYTGGLDITDPAMAEFLTADTRLYLLGQDKIYQAPLDKLESAGLTFRSMR